MPSSNIFCQTTITFAGLLVLTAANSAPLAAQQGPENRIETEVRSMSIAAPDVNAPNLWRLDRGYLFLGSEFVVPGSELAIDTPDANQVATNLVDQPKATIPTINTDVYQTLTAGGFAIVLPNDQQYSWKLQNGGLAILTSLVSKQAGAELPKTSELPPEFQQPALQSWLNSANLNRSATRRAKADIKKLTETVAGNMAASRALSRLSNYGYPLTIAAMILVVVSFGHLLSFRPQEMSRDAQQTAVITQATSKSIVLVGLMGLLDLVMTVMSFQANAMQEINPVAGQLMKNIPALVTFKIGLTAFALVVLFYARAIRIAQLAAWWGCLIMTLLTARWVIFSHMAIS